MRVRRTFRSEKNPPATPAVAAGGGFPCQASAVFMLEVVKGTLAVCALHPGRLFAGHVLSRLSAWDGRCKVLLDQGGVPGI